MTSRPRRRPLQDSEIVDTDPELGAKLFEFLMERPPLVVLLLPHYVSLDRCDAIRTHRERAVSTLPSERRDTFPKPISGRLLDLTDYVRDRVRRTKTAEEVNMIFHAADIHVGDIKVSGNSREVGMTVRTRRAIEKRASTPCGEDYVDING
jgi:hypothetical protein